eukprot:PhM_4_TR932/c0_g1_i1/m.87579/K11086/SNRPB, SMB; small nuclear ribonucleoprotein B and B'
MSHHSNKNKLISYIGCRVSVTSDDRRVFTGKLVAFDKLMNVTLLDAEEDITGEGVHFKQIGFMLLRGECVRAVCVENAYLSRHSVDTRMPAPPPNAAYFAASLNNNSASNLNSTSNNHNNSNHRSSDRTQSTNNITAAPLKRQRE